MTDSEWELILEFPDGSPSFCHGFEAGRIWERMHLMPHAVIDQTVSDENREVFVRMAKSCGWRAEFEAVNNDGWERVILTPPGGDRQ